MKAFDWQGTGESIIQRIPKMQVTLDFETFYDSKNGYDLKVLTTEEYVRDPRFMVQGMAIKLNDKPSRWIDGPHNVRKILNQIPLHRALVVAHNAVFDGFILSEIYNVYPAMWADTMSLAAMLYGNNLPSASLGALSKRFLPRELWKDATALVDVDGILHPSRAQMNSLGEYSKGDADRCYELFRLFYPRVQGYNPLQPHIVDTVIRMFTDPALILDGEILQASLTKEQDDKAAAVESCVAGDSKALRSNLQLAELLRGLGVEPPVKISPTTGATTYAFAKTDREFVDLQYHENPQVRALVTARLRVKSSIEETRAESYLGVSTRGLWPVALNVSGARTTHRLSGNSAGGGNPQNLGKKSPLRKAIYPQQEYHLMVLDSANIELRVAMVVAGELDVVQQWRNNGIGFDVYKVFAAYFYGCEIHEVTPRQRELGKLAMLSLQYGSGFLKFKQTAWGKGTELSDEEAAQVVMKYRQAFQMVVRAWEQMGHIVKMLQRGVVVESPYARYAQPSLRTIADCAGLELPGGMPITYPGLAYVSNVQTGKRELTYVTYGKHRNDIDMAGAETYGVTTATGGLRQKIFGAKSFEHVCQATASNIVLAQTLMLERWLQDEVHPRCQIVLSVHDEAVSVIPDEAVARHGAENILDQSLQIMRTAPDWAEEIPLDATGAISKSSYGETKP